MRILVWGGYLWDLIDINDEIFLNDGGDVFIKMRNGIDWVGVLYIVGVYVKIRLIGCGKLNDNCLWKF